MALNGAGKRAANVIVGVAVVVIACQPPVPSLPSLTERSHEPPVPSPSAGPQAGGTIYLLMQSEGWAEVDPQRVTTPEDLAFLSGTLYRSLVSPAYSPNPIEAARLVPDLAIDLGTPTDGGRTWSFTLREGVRWEDGSALVCDDLAYGVSRTFATDLMGGGPHHAIAYLDIPRNGDGSSKYPGPDLASPEEQGLFDAAVECDGGILTFHPNQAVGDFNQATTLGMSPVPDLDVHPGLEAPGEGYGVTSPVWSSGPYRVEDYEPGPNGTMVLVRNEHWKAESDPIRKAYPDRWVVEFGLDPLAIDGRLMAAEGDDRFALGYEQVQPESLPRIYGDDGLPNAPFHDRALSGFDPFTRYFWVDVKKVRNEKLRQAIGVALDRAAVLDIFGAAYGGSGYGQLYGDLADGALKPSAGPDYAGTGYYDNLFGFPIPPEGDAEAARRLIAESGEEAPTLEWNYADTPIGQQYFAVVEQSLERAGFEVEPGPIVPFGGYCCVPFDPRDALTGEFGNAAIAPAWPNASTVIPRMFGSAGDWAFSRVDDAGFDARIRDAVATLDREAQARKWQELNREVVQRGWIIPTLFTRTQVLAGTDVEPIYRWPAFASWPYGVMSVKP